MDAKELLELQKRILAHTWGGRPSEQQSLDDANKMVEDVNDELVMKEFEQQNIGMGGSRF